MDDNLFKIIIFVIAIALGWFAGNGAVYVFNKLPVRWLTDYGEAPLKELLKTADARLPGYPWKLLFSMFFIASGIWLVQRFSMEGYGHWSVLAQVVASLITMWLLLLVAIADGKYGIIPDEPVLFLAVTAIAYVPYKVSFLDPLYGALLGGGVMLLVAVLCKLLYRKDVLGMGDVKLMTAIGLILGLYDTAAVLMVTSLASLVGFGYGMMKGKLKITDTAPLGPYIVGAAYVCMLFDISGILL